MSDINTQRRQLLRGSASVPVVLTVLPGTTLANSSSMCLTNIVRDHPDDPTHLSAAPDGWLRCEVTKITSYKKTNNSWVKQADYVKPTGVDSATDNGTLVCPKDVYYKLDANGNPSAVPEQPPTGAYYKLVDTYEKKSALVLFQPRDSVGGTPGHIKGFAWQDSLKVPGTQKITRSCACSFV